MSHSEYRKLFVRKFYELEVYIHIVAQNGTPGTNYLVVLDFLVINVLHVHVLLWELSLNIECNEDCHQ